jgi:hypothetical protein
MLTMFSCSDELDRNWKDPGKYEPQPDEVVSGLFTHMQKTRFWLEDYGEWYYLLNYGIFEMAQVTALVPYSESFINHFADDEYGNLDKYVYTANGKTYERFSKFYTDLTNYMLIGDEIKAAQTLDKSTDDIIIYQRLATILKDIVALQTVDLFNSIPYFDAFKGTAGVFFPKYDDPMEIYKNVIEEYKTIAAELPSIYGKMSPGAKSMFETQDLFFKGDINKWVQYINSQNLKACVRISGVAEDFVKPYIAEAIKNLPTEDFTFSSPYLNECRVGSSGNGGIIQRGRYENYYQMAIPDVIMTRMNRGSDQYDINEDDPRLPTIGLGFSPYGTKDSVEYFGVSMDCERQRYLRITLPLGEGRRSNVLNPLDTTPDIPHNSLPYPSQPMDVMVKSCMWTYYNPITYVLSEMPLRIVSQAETDLFLAEVALKNLASTGKAAGAHINDAVKHSTDYWYMMNHAPNYAGDMSDDTKAILTPDKPSEDIISNYAGKVQGEFEAAGGLEDKMEILMQQKYIHLNISGAYELFAELRRTRHPKLEPITCKSSGIELVNQTMMLERFTLPPSEKSANFDQYSKVMADDKWGTPVFWVPQSKISEKYFLPTAIKPPLP